MTTDDDRIAYLAGEHGARLHPDDQASLEDLRDLLSDPAVWAEPDPSLEDSVVAAIAAEVEGTELGRPLDAPPLNAPPQADTAVRAARRRAADRTWSPRRRLAYVLAGVAAAVAVFAISLSALTGSGSAAPRFTAALAPSSASPSDASGSATLTRTSTGWRVYLKAEGLPRRDSGQFYEAWLRNGAGAHVAIGTFNEGPDVTLWAGVSPKDFPTVVVTAEESNRNPSVPGHVVLIGDARPKGAGS
jgi:hypothetical protein